MKRVGFTVLVVALAAAAIAFESTPQGGAVRDFLQGWLAANALPENPQTITAIELPAGKGGLPALDAALALRAALRSGPRVVAFPDTIEDDASASLFLSKLGDAKMPVVFTADTRLESLPHVAIAQNLPPFAAAPALRPEGHPAGGAGTDSEMTASLLARQGSQAVPSSVLRACLVANGIPLDAVSGSVPGVVRAGDFSVPVDAAGYARINPLASLYMHRIALDQLMLRSERSEQGGISVDLQTLFRDRVVVVQREGENGALAIAAWQNHLLEFPLPPYLQWLPLLVVATLPWWPARRVNRALLALGASGFWLLLSLAFLQEFQIALPLLAMVLLPILALIPPGAAPRSNEVEQGELPA